MEELASLRDQEYFRKGIVEIINNKNPGYVPAYGSPIRNGKGILFKFEDFKEIIESYNILINLRSLPDKFLIKIKYSPISLFRKWIFTMTDEGIEEKKATPYNFFKKEYFLLAINDEFNFFPISSNIAHENFLLNLYNNQLVEEYNLSFQTFFTDVKKMVLFKDYSKRKVFTLNIPREFNIIKGRPYNIKVSVIKNLKGARFKLKINGNKIEHLIRFSSSSRIGVGANSSKNLVKKEAGLIGEEKNLTINNFRKEVIKTLKENHARESKTNKFANISLGRINRIMVLVNLSQKYKNKKIKMIFDEMSETLKIYNEDEKLVKSFMISYSPKSNWLEKIKNK